MTKEEQDIIDSANNENYLGQDDSGNAIIKNAQGQVSSYGGADWKSVTDAIKAKHGPKSYNDYVGNEQLKSLGGEYQGRDEETGAAVFKKGNETFGVDKDDADYKHMFNAVQKADPNKTWANPEYERQFNEAQSSGNKFSGFDSSGNAISQNQLGQYQTVENKDGGFYKFAKKNMSDQKFAGVQGVSNATVGENLAPGKLNQNKVGTDNDKSRRALDDTKGGYSRFSAGKNVGVEKTSPPPVEYTPPTVGQNNAPATKYSATRAAQSARVRKIKSPISQEQEPAPIGIKDIALKMGKEYATDFANNKLAEAKTTAKTAVTDMAKEQSQPYLNQAKAATQPFKDQAIGAINNATGVDVTKSVMNQAAGISGISNLGDISNAIKDPGAYLKQQAEDKAKSYVSDKLGFDVGAAINDPKKFLVKQGVDQLAQYAGADAGTLGKAVGLLRGNVVDNTRNLAKEQAKEQALKQVGSATGVDVEVIKGGLSVGKNLMKGGLSEDTSRKTGETAARAALMSATGGVVSPESLAFASAMQNKGSDYLNDKLGVAGAAPGELLRLGAVGTQAGSEIANAGISLAGNLAADNYNYGKNVVGGLKMIGKGNLGGVTDIAKATLQNTFRNAVKTPVAAVKSVVSAVSGAIKSIFCFDQDTEILMENGTYKKIKEIKLGDKVELGGLVTAIGQSASDEIYDYNGVKVSAGHAVFEDGKWVRISDSKYAVELKGDKRLVFPMSTEHHLIVTKGQVWADNLEVDDTYDFKDSEILDQLNKKTVRNKMLKTYVKVKFGNS